jgi:hypothetical protein
MTIFHHSIINLKKKYNTDYGNSNKNVIKKFQKK